MPFTLSGPVHSENTIKKSRFIGCVEPVADRAAAQRRLAGLRVAHPNATHVCWALMAGGHSAANDDGEPGGTAGRPMLEVLRHQDLDSVLATVVRYYGGTPLGAGGLVRAYTDSVAQALLQAHKVPVVRWRVLRCVLPYALEGWLRRELDAHGASLIDARHGDGVSVSLRLPDTGVDALVARLTNAGQGRVVWLKDEPSSTGHEA
ncbi:IMPACT family protein [Hydrogenophaga laconesensis]|uniref:YigZ family protein n=1 Tax=Hydrogenophaga laconesensis TaxID=1805971 RepID=A0ABU1VHC2_9BURK|nr:YigZ family protein [Hydrogenophaga laconesensis]MDR7096881.1 putative YigZ family protein [Hydrogenophaga laconesensis]